MKNFEVKIGGYTWKVEFVPKEAISGNDGLTRPNDFTLLLRNDLLPKTTYLVFIHEVVHALLDTQGRCYQKKFDVEEMCEFVSFRYDEIVSIVDTFNREAFREERKVEPAPLFVPVNDEKYL